MLLSTIYEEDNQVMHRNEDVFKLLLSWDICNEQRLSRVMHRKVLASWRYFQVRLCQWQVGVLLPFIFVVSQKKVTKIVEVYRRHFSLSKWEDLKLKTEKDGGTNVVRETIKQQHYLDQSPQSPIQVRSQHVNVCLHIKSMKIFVRHLTKRPRVRDQSVTSFLLVEGSRWNCCITLSRNFPNKTNV